MTLAKKPQKADDTPEPAAAVVADPDPTPAPRNPRTTIGIETAAHGAYAYEAVTDPDWKFDRRLTLRGQNYEHTSTDADGVWIYRSM